MLPKASIWKVERKHRPLGCSRLHRYAFKDSPKIMKDNLLEQVAYGARTIFSLTACSAHGAYYNLEQNTTSEYHGQGPAPKEVKRQKKHQGRV